MENFDSQGTQSFLICKNQLCHDFSILNPILNFVEKHSSKLKTRIEPLHSKCQLQEAKREGTINRTEPKV